MGKEGLTPLQKANLLTSPERTVILVIARNDGQLACALFLRGT